MDIVALWGPAAWRTPDVCAEGGKGGKGGREGGRGEGERVTKGRGGKGKRERGEKGTGTGEKKGEKGRKREKEEREEGGRGGGEEEKEREERDVCVWRERGSGEGGGDLVLHVRVCEDVRLNGEDFRTSSHLVTNTIRVRNRWKASSLVPRCWHTVSKEFPS